VKHPKHDITGDLLDDLDLILIEIVAASPGIGFREITQAIPDHPPRSDWVMRMRLKRLAAAGLLGCKKVLGRYDTWYARPGLEATACPTTVRWS